jgi:hypothetical protein
VAAAAPPKISGQSSSRNVKILVMHPFPLPSIGWKGWGMERLDGFHFFSFRFKLVQFSSGRFPGKISSASRCNSSAVFTGRLPALVTVKSGFPLSVTSF